MRKFRFSSKVIKIFMKNQIQNKTYIILDVFNMVSRCLVVFFLYGYVFSINGGSINVADYVSSLWSMFIYFCIMTFNIRKIYKNIMDEVRSGNVEMFINRPVNYLFLNFCKSIGQGLFSFLVISFIGSILMCIFVGIPVLNMSIFIPTFIISFIFGGILSLILYSIVGVLAFFIQDVRPVYWIVDKFVMILGGSYLPVSMFPSFLKWMAYLSPFGAINFSTSCVLPSWESEFIYRIGLQVIWIIIFYFVLSFIYRKALEKSMVNGG